jgi:hypothetical protein
VLVQDFARMAREFVELLNGAEDMLPFDFLSACARLLPPLCAMGINLPDANPEDDSATRSVYPFDESRGVSPAMGSGFCAQCAADPGDGFDGVEFLRADTHRGWGIARSARFS